MALCRRFFALLGALCLLVACSPRAAPESKTITVFAAASLTEPFTEMGQAFAKSQAGVIVTFNFAGSQQLRTQLEQGARADVFAAANRKEMDAAQAAGLLQGASQIFARNCLVVVMPKDNPGQIGSLADLAKPGLRLVVAHESVPVGNYTHQAIAKMAQDPAYGSDFARRVLANVVSEDDNVRQVLAKVQLGEADAGVVYITDVTEKAQERVITLDIPDAFNQIAEYPIAVLGQSREATLARAFVDYVKSLSGQAILQKYGFLASDP